MTEEEEFKKLFQKIVEMYQISSDTAAELLKKILTILTESRNEDETTEKKKEGISNEKVNGGIGSTGTSE